MSTSKPIALARPAPSSSPACCRSPSRRPRSPENARRTRPATIRFPAPPRRPSASTEMELASIDLAKESVKLPERRLRYRHMEIQPGGIVPLHSHADRPALIMVNQGQIFEYSSKCTVPISHKAGEIARESNGLMHWWKNEGNVVVVLTIADIVNDKKPDSMMPMM